MGSHWGQKVRSKNRDTFSTNYSQLARQIFLGDLLCENGTVIYASREILRQLENIFTAAAMVISVGRENIAGVEVNWVIRWNVKITRWNWGGTTTGTSSLLPFPVDFSNQCSISVRSGLWSLVSHLLFGVFCFVILGARLSVTLMIPTFLEEWNSKQLQMDRNWKFKSNFLVGQTGQRNKQKQLQSRNIFTKYKDSVWPASAIYLSQLNR